METTRLTPTTERALAFVLDHLEMSVNMLGVTSPVDWADDDYRNVMLNTAKAKVAEAIMIVEAVRQG